MGGWVTAIATPMSQPNSDILLSASRDKTVILWKLTRDEESYGYPLRRLRGHSHYVEDVVISSDGQFALSGSWDHTMRLWDHTIKIWDLESKTTVDELRPEFPPVGKKAQTPYCTSLAWSSDGSTLFSGYTDNKIRVWSVSRTL